jgi:hypothetical protein
MSNLSKEIIQYKWVGFSRTLVKSGNKRMLNKIQEKNNFLIFDSLGLSVARRTSQKKIASDECQRQIKEEYSYPCNGSRSPYDCETSRFPHFLGNRFTDGGEVVSLTAGRSFTPLKIPDTHFY